MDKKQRKSWDSLMAVWNGDFVACQTHFAKVYTREYPNDIFGWIALADGLSKASAFADAFIAIRKARTLCPAEMRSFLHSQMGHIYREKGDHARAANWYRRAIKEDPSQENLLFLGTCLLKLGDLKNARKLLTQAVDIKPDLADEAFFNLGLSYRAEGNYVEALRFFEKAIAIDPEYVYAIDARSDILKLFEMRALPRSVRSTRS